MTVRSSHLSAVRPDVGAASAELLDGVVWFSAIDRTMLDAPVADRTMLDAPVADPLAVHLWRYGPRPAARGPAGDRLLADVEAVGLTGRGGAHFPVAAKWRTARDAGPGVVVVANGAEGEPLSAKDSALLRLRPHLVLDGLASTAEYLGAEAVAIWLHRGTEAETAALSRALQERQAAGLGDPSVHLAYGPDRYLSGESSAVVRALNGGPALPAFSRVPTAVQGVAGRPTVIQNVETLARVAVVARGGAGGAVPGPLVTVLTDAVLTVAELATGTTVWDAVSWATSPWSGRPEAQAVLIGGYGGSWHSWKAASGLQLGRLDGRRPAPPRSSGGTRRLTAVLGTGGSLGAGVLAPLPHDACGLVETAAILDYLARSGARQCGPCLFGTRALADGMARIADGTARRRDVGALTRVLGEVDGRGACSLPDGAVQLTRSALEVFAEDVERHIRRGPCGRDGSAGLVPARAAAPW